MGKRIIQQRRGRGGNTYRVKKKAFELIPKYLPNLNGSWEVVNLISTKGHSVPIAKLRNEKGEIFNNFACEFLFVGQKITINGNKPGDISKLGDLKNGTKIFNIEMKSLDGGKFVRTGGNYAEVVGKVGNLIKVWMPSKKEKLFEPTCRATIGRLSGDGRMEKPILKAGKKFYIMSSKSKLWPRTSAVKMNKIDHPFGSGRGKRVKSKIAKRNASPGKKVGLIRPRQTGRKKR